MSAGKPAVAGKCDHCGGELLHRSDDNEETVRNRLRVYREETEPVIRYYEGRNILRRVSGDRDPDEVHREIAAVIDVIIQG